MPKIELKHKIITSLVWCLSNTYKLGCKFRLGI